MIPIDGAHYDAPEHWRDIHLEVDFVGVDTYRHGGDSTTHRVAVPFCLWINGERRELSDPEVLETFTREKLEDITEKIFED